MKKLEGKTAIITGSGRGIGRALALKLASEGASVVVNDLDEEPAAETVNAILAAGGKAVACVGSVTDPAFADRFVKTAVDNFGGIEIIVNNAGYTWDGVVQKMSDEQFDAMMEVHVKAPFRIFRAAADTIKELYKGDQAAGREIVRKVVNISSMSGTNGNAGQINYSSAKSALVGMTKTMSKEWGRYKVAVNCVAFGFIETRLTKSMDDPASKLKIGDQEIQAGVPDMAINMLPMMVPLGRAGTPEEAAGAIYLFCIPESDYVSGQVLLCGGGINT
ncbi:SDR family NAD(P)-dependent oxidoreductase [Novosphingobium aquae]|uniref:SDR family NAD(P)-dependent oxidoreductase n=1 Tax=Novosphingobium aquae TaxID=3133435 RepID=A0ABU8SC25_9SPHN